MLIFYSQTENANVPPEFVAWMVAIPTFDFIRVTIMRLVQKRRLFLGDRSHFHHNLLEAGLTNVEVTLAYGFASLFFLLQGYLVSLYLRPFSTVCFILADWLTVF